MIRLRLALELDYDVAELAYNATVDLSHHIAEPGHVGEVRWRACLRRC